MFFGIFRKSRILICLFVALVGCKEAIYTGLTAREVNEMVAVLVAAQVSAGRSETEPGLYSLMIDGDDLAVAATILDQHGLPHKKFRSMDEIFTSEGLVGTPFEEQVRYTYALEEQLTKDIVSISGIRDAGITVSLPKEAPRGRGEAKPGSASVIVHYEANFEMQASVPKLKKLISGAITGLQYEDVTIVAFPVVRHDSGARPQSMEKTKRAGILDIDSVWFFVVASLGLSIAFSAFLLIQNFLRRRR